MTKSSKKCIIYKLNKEIEHYLVLYKVEDEWLWNDGPFGSNPELVSKMVINYARGLQDNNVSATLKHFPFI